MLGMIVSLGKRNNKGNYTDWKVDQFGNKKDSNIKTLTLSFKSETFLNRFFKISLKEIDFLEMFNEDTELSIIDIKEIYANLDGYLRHLKDLNNKYQIEKDSWVIIRAKKIENYLLYKKLNNLTPNKKEITKKRKI